MMASLSTGNASYQPLVRRPTDILGGPTKIIDQTGERVKEDFLVFLERYREGNLAAGTNGNNSGIPTSEMLTGSEPTVLSGNHDSPLYLQQLADMRNEGRSTLYVDFNHLYRYNDVLANAIADNHYRFEPVLRRALTAFVQAHAPSYCRLPNSHQPRQFWVSIYGISIVHRLRELTTHKVGQLVSVSGTVTRTSEVRPELLVGTFRCNECGAVSRDVEQQFRYTEPVKCMSDVCNGRRAWTLIPEQSVFVNWQRVRLQENSNEIPAGSMPRCIDVIVRNDMAEKAKAGDKCVFTGMPIVTPDVAMLLPGNKLESGGMEGAKRGGGPGNEGITGLKALGVREMTYKLSFIAHMVQSVHNNNTGSINIRSEDDDDLLGDDERSPESMFSSQELEEIERIRNMPNLYQRLVNSMAPSIFGHHEIKAGILLMLFGGVHKTTMEGINLRGDINVCIVGDPGTAKSQFLRYVIGFLPRSVYTSGKASSAAGLTASVLKDEETGEFTIEAGALMLADNGICAIDEFDKMDLKDQVAIHEAMEQQTISIAKAGIHATLNARTSILAAANPVGGRYDRKKTLKQNISMSPPIMSRFDLFFVVLDECNEQHDYSIARHLLNVHRYRDSPVEAEFSAEQIQRYIRYARTIKPKLSSEASELLVERYKQLRAGDVTGAGSSYRITVRQLESLIRLSEALARLHCDLEVKAAYVQEACRLLKSSIIRVEVDNVDLTMSAGAFTEAAVELHKSVALNSGTDDRSPDQHFQLKYDEYLRITNMLVYQLRRIESDNASNEEMQGMKRSELIDWFLEQIEEEIGTEQELDLKRAQIGAVVDRLSMKDHVLLSIKASGGLAIQGHSDDPYLVVHPNYAF